MNDELDPQSLRSFIAAMVAGDVYSNLSDTESVTETIRRTAEISVRIADAILVEVKR